MIRRIRTRIRILFINLGLVRVEPWEDPRRSPEDRQAWRDAKPKSLRRSA